REALLEGINSFACPPHIIIGNQHEIKYLGQSDNSLTALQNVPFDSDIVIETLGPHGALVRMKLNGERYVDVFPIGEVGTDVGTRDVFMGATLAYLLRKPRREWSEQHILEAAYTGSYAGARQMETTHSHLQSEGVRQVREFMRSPHRVNGQPVVSH